MNISNIGEIQEICKRFNIEVPKVFIETGTFIGQTAFEMSNHFDKIYSIEIQEKLYEDVVNIKNKKGIDNVNFLLGDSGEKIIDIIKEVEEPSVFFLDAHYAGTAVWDSTGKEAIESGSWIHKTWTKDWEYRDWNKEGKEVVVTGRGEKDVPMMEELIAIGEYFNHGGIIICDDLNHWGKDLYHGDWSDISIEKVLGCLKNTPVLGHYVTKADVNNPKTPHRLIINIDKKN